MLTTCVTHLKHTFRTHLSHTHTQRVAGRLSATGELGRRSGSVISPVAGGPGLHYAAGGAGAGGQLTPAAAAAAAAGGGVPVVLDRSLSVPGEGGERHSMAQRGTAWHSMAQRGMAQHSIKHGKAQPYDPNSTMCVKSRQH